MSDAILIPSKLAERVLINRNIVDNSKSDIPISYTLDRMRNRYPLRTMLIGQHFFVPCAGRSVEQTQNAVTSAVGNIQRKTGKKFHQRRYPTGIRVWRTK